MPLAPAITAREHVRWTRARFDSSMNSRSSAIKRACRAADIVTGGPLQVTVLDEAILQRLGQAGQEPAGAGEDFGVELVERAQLDAMAPVAAPAAERAHVILVGQDHPYGPRACLSAQGVDTLDAVLRLAVAGRREQKSGHRLRRDRPRQRRSPASAARTLSASMTLNTIGQISAFVKREIAVRAKIRVQVGIVAALLRALIVDAT